MDLTRREALSAAALAGVCAPFLAACGATSANPTSGGGGTAGLSVKAAEVPVGGGILTADGSTIVTQPVAGSYKAFQAICTHRGTALPAPVGGVITCPLHGSRFGLDGSVEQGPASSALQADALTVKNGTITVQS